MLIFTLSYIKSLPNALVLGDSLKKLHPEINFYIGLVDDKTNIPSSISINQNIISINDLKNSTFESLQAKYNENELLPNCKPLYFEYFLNKSNTVVYLDCTSLIYGKIDFIVESFVTHDILLTPQLLIANKHPKENNALNSGVFHSGFIGLKNTENTQNFLNWWQSHTSQKGFIDLCKGMNADQYCLEIAPTLFENVKIMKHLGLNVGEWNLPERDIKEHEGRKYVGSDELITFNYKGSKITKEYKNLIENYHHKTLSKVPIAYGIPLKNLSKFSTFLLMFAKAVNRKIDTFFDLF